MILYHEFDMLKPRQRIIRKNFIAAFLLTFLLWTVWVIFFFFTPPEYFLTPLVFLLISFLAILFTFALLFANTRRGLLVALGAISFMALRYYEIGNYLNLLLLAGVLLSLEYYLSNN